jgi:hypothetical protein
MANKPRPGPPPGDPKPKRQKPMRERLQINIPDAKSIGDNLTKPTDDIVDLNFKIPESFHRRFKAEATLRGISMRELLESSFKCFTEVHGSTVDKSLFEK